MTESGRDWLDDIFEMFSSSDENERSLFEDLEDSACVIAKGLMNCRTRKDKAFYRGLAKDYFNVAKKYVGAFEALSNDPEIVSCAETGTCGPYKIEWLKQKKDNLCRTIQALEGMLRKRPNRALREEIACVASLRRPDKSQQEDQVKRIFDEVASFVESTKRKH